MMLYQLFEYSEDRKKKFPLGSHFVMLFSLSEITLQAGVKRLKKIDPSIKAVTDITGIQPKHDPKKCTMFPGSQEDMEALYKNY